MSPYVKALQNGWLRFLVGFIILGITAIFALVMAPFQIIVALIMDLIKVVGYGQSLAVGQLLLIPPTQEFIDRSNAELEERKKAERAIVEEYMRRQSAATENEGFNPRKDNLQ